jgi:hypothetical protein
VGRREVTRAPLFSRTSILLGVAVALAAGTVLVISAVTAGRVHMLESDGASFAAIARDPFGNAATIHGFGHQIDGTAYRFGRMLMPFLAWLLAGGQAGATTVTLPIVVACGFGLSVAAAAELARRHARPPALGLVVLAVPYTFFWVQTPHLVSDPAVTGFVLTSYLLDVDGRRGLARVVAALTILTREAAALAFLPLVWRDWKERRRGAVRDWSLVLAPYVAWCLWLRVRTGFFPFTDPASSRRGALSLPLLGIVRMYRGGAPSGPLFTLLVAGATLLVALLVGRERRWFPVRDGGLWLTALILCYGTGVWALWGEALRVMSTAQSLLLLALVAGARVPAGSDEDARATPRSRTGTG